MEVKLNMVYQYTNSPYQYLTTYETDIPCQMPIDKAEKLCFAMAEALVRKHINNPERKISERSVKVIRNVEKNSYAFEYAGCEPLNIMICCMKIAGSEENAPKCCIVSEGEADA